MGKRCKGKRALLLIFLLVVLLPVFLVACGGDGGGGYSPPAATVAEFYATPDTGTAPLTVAFTDNSTGGPTSWEWDFGDGSALDNTQNPSHTYSAADTYAVTLTVDGPGGMDNVTKDITVTAPGPAPTVAAFSAVDNTVLEGDVVEFTDESTGGPTSWEWDFGDNTALSAEQNPDHIYNDNGVFTVTLTVDGPGGLDTITRPAYITVGPLPDPPVADFSADNTTGTAPLDVQFTDNSTGLVSTWSWDFGDNTAGPESTVEKPLHRYTAVGTYDVTLTVTNPGGPDNVTQLGLITVEPFTDDFNRDDEDPLAGNWTTGPDCNDLQLSSNQVSATINGAGFNCAYWSDNNTFNNDQYSQVTFVTLDTNTGKGPAVRIQTGVDNQYMYYAIVEDATSISIKKNENRVYTVIETIPFVPALIDGDTIKLSVEGDTLEVFVNGDSIGTTTDNTFSSGAPGIWINSTGSSLDDWEGGSL